jgi:hypothetical protein
MQVSGIDIVNGVYRRLRKPSQADLAWQDVVAIAGEVVARMKLDLMMSPQGETAILSDWFVPPAQDFALDDIGLHDVLLPTRVEMKSIDSQFETGADVPCVNFDVLNTSIVGAVAFHATPLRITFRDPTESIQQMQYRMVYETDMVGDLKLDSVTGLPGLFKSKAILDTAYEACELVEDPSNEWMNFVKMYRPSWEAQMARNKQDWIRYIRKFRGKSQIPKRRFFDNRSAGVGIRRTLVFGQDPPTDIDGGTP